MNKQEESKTGFIVKLTESQWWLWGILSVTLNVIRLPVMIELTHFPPNSIATMGEYLVIGVIDFPVGILTSLLSEAVSHEVSRIMIIVVGGLQWCVWSLLISLAVTKIFALMMPVKKRKTRHRSKQMIVRSDREI